MSANSTEPQEVANASHSLPVSNKRKCEQNVIVTPANSGLAKRLRMTGLEAPVYEETFELHEIPIGLLESDPEPKRIVVASLDHVTIITLQVKNASMNPCGSFRPSAAHKAIMPEHHSWQLDDWQHDIEDMQIELCDKVPETVRTKDNLFKYIRKDYERNGVFRKWGLSNWKDMNDNLWIKEHVEHNRALSANAAGLTFDLKGHMDDESAKIRMTRALEKFHTVLRAKLFASNSQLSASAFWEDCVAIAANFQNEIFSIRATGGRIPLDDDPKVQQQR